MPRLDPHSYSDDAQPSADVLHWRAHVDFDNQTLTCQARLTLPEPARSGPLDLDTRALEIQSVVDQSGAALPFELGECQPILGSRLRIGLADGTSAIEIAYRTTPEATAMQWLAPEQTDGRGHPFLYTQCQPIHARSIVPLQDTPRTRLRFTAELNVPRGLTALMAAEAVGPQRDQDGRSVARFSMPQPMAPYLFAFAVGDLASRELGPRSRVWAEPGVVDQAAWEFAATDRLLAAGEKLFGTYDWGRYDILVLPPAFPYGGMENPRLTFLTPSVIAGDRSLVAVIAHELAHSWTGNLISNANAEHFWLNEGGATYAERRIVEEVWGSDMAALDWALGRRELDEAIQRLMDAGTPGLTCLRTHLAGLDPDEAYTVLPYEKGALLLRALEQAAGRPAFDRFLREYIRTFRFAVLTSEEFLTFVRQHLPGTGVDLDKWVFEPGPPPDVRQPPSDRLDAITALAGGSPGDDQAHAWSAAEWQLYLDSLEPPAPRDRLADLDRRFDLTTSRNYDVLAKWLVLGILSDYPPALDRVPDVLRRIGRMKYLRPLYRALAERQPGLANTLFVRNAAHYHPIARLMIEGVLRTRRAP